MKKLLWSLCFALAMGAWPWACPSHALTVRVGDYPPFVYPDEEGGWVGSELKLVREVVKASGMEASLSDLPWNRAIKWIELGKLDILYSLARTEEREQFIDFIGPSRFEQMCLIVRKEGLGLEVGSLDDLKKLSGPIGIQDGVHYPGLSETLEADKELASRFRIVHKDQLNARMTANGRLQGFFEERSFAHFMVNKDPALAGLKVHSFCLTEPQPVYMGASRKLPEEVRRKLHETYESMATSGRIKSLMNVAGD